ncbi:MAG TPA: hypothetical protein VNI01_03250 [Elusimicrobiota bacterium]|nr:hypothetical protein [Elusimicrobiota bacterium]
MQPPKSAGVDAVAEAADAVARDASAAGRHSGAEAGLLERLRARHADFSTCFPLVFRWIVQTGEYSPRAMRRFLRWYAKQSYSESAEAFLRAQCEFMVFMEREKKRLRPDKMGPFREALVSAALREHKAFVQAAADADRADREREEGLALRKRELLRALAEQARARERLKTAGPGEGSPADSAPVHRGAEA